MELDNGQPPKREDPPEASGDGDELGSIVAVFDLTVTMRRLALSDIDVAGDGPSSADMERIATEALGSYKAAFGVDAIRVRARRSDR